jgi:hypothetical protein
LGPFWGPESRVFSGKQIKCAETLVARSTFRSTLVAKYPFGGAVLVVLETTTGLVQPFALPCVALSNPGGGLGEHPCTELDLPDPKGYSGVFAFQNASLTKFI